MKKIVVAYSGGLDTSVLLKWLKDHYGGEVIAFCADVGQGEELDGLEEKALNTGASKCFISDLKEEFAADYIYPMFQAGALYEGQYLLGTSIARPCISKGIVEVAQREAADAVAHGATGKGNDQVRFQLSVAALAPEMEVIAPWRMQVFRDQFPGRAEMIRYAARENIPVQASAARSYSIDRNLLHISFESGALEDPWYDVSGKADRDMYVLSVSPEEAQEEPEYVELLFDRGRCIGLKNERLAQLMESRKITSPDHRDGHTLLSPLGVMLVLNQLGGEHGIGRVDMVENRFVGMKSRGIYETPGGTILFHAHRQMESLTMDREVMRVRDGLIPEYSRLVYNGFWFAPERLAIQALVTESQKHVSGVVRLKLFKGNVITAGRRSPLSLYHPDVATMEAAPIHAYDQDHASGFIHLHALRLKTGVRVHGARAKSSTSPNT